jgi:hypothetical protein
MKTARFLLACTVASVLAACGSDPITAPAAAPRSPAADESACVKTTVVTSSGGTTEVCIDSVTGSQMGSGY